MRNNAVYFPYIDVPSNAWFFRVLLYWDKVSSIVPYDYVHNPNLLEPHMRDLLTAELVEQVTPGSYIYQIPKFEEAFLEYVNRRINSNYRTFSNRTKNIQLHRAERILHPSSIHMEKMGDLAEELEKIGLARPSQPPWYEVEGWVAKAFMCYLASALGNLDEISAAPVTNDWDNYRLFRGNKVIIRPRENIRRTRIRQLLLNNLLPGPSELPDIDSIINFKISYGNLLSKLRNTVEIHCIQIANVEEDAEREAMVNLLLREIEDEVEEISEAMKSRWKRISFGILIPILGAGASFFAEDPFHNPMAITAAGLSLANTVYQAFEGVQNYEKVLNQPLAYVALARATFM